MIHIKKIAKKIPKIFICYAALFLCVFMFLGKNINIDTNLNQNNQNNETYADYLSEQTTVPVTSETSSISDNPDIPDNPEVSETFEDLIASESEIIKEPEKIYTLSELDDYSESPESVRYYKQIHLREILISAVGDMTLGSNYTKPYPGSFYEYYDLYGPGYFCENVKHIFNESDCVIANLECTLTDNQDPAIRQDKPYTYKGYNEYASILTAGNIDIVNIANNHTHDYSEEGYNDTIEALIKEGTEYFGNGIALIKEINGIKIGFLGCREGYWRWELQAGLDYLAENNVEVKIVSFHWLVMDERIANQNEVEAAHYAIDNGVDLVIAHHPHVLQGIEIYKGKYIAYSLGNFIFDGNVISDIENRTSIIFQQRFVLYGSEIVDSSINLIPILTTSNMSRNNFRPMLAEGEQKEAILEKIKARSAGYNTFD
ncbi:MAG: CapA family protein [Oscillospiraceae bacterium]|nr:CapA family protein [Oscillospiraceae bacterium]